MALVRIFQFLRDEEDQQMLKTSERKAFKPNEC